MPFNYTVINGSLISNFECTNVNTYCDVGYFYYAVLLLVLLITVIDYYYYKHIPRKEYAKMQNMSKSDNKRKDSL